LSFLFIPLSPFNPVRNRYRQNIIYRWGVQEINQKSKVKDQKHRLKRKDLELLEAGKRRNTLRFSL
jgi:hypothetical protein